MSRVIKFSTSHRRQVLWRWGIRKDLQFRSYRGSGNLSSSRGRWVLEKHGHDELWISRGTISFFTMFLIKIINHPPTTLIVALTSGEANWTEGAMTQSNLARFWLWRISTVTSTSWVGGLPTGARDSSGWEQKLDNSSTSLDYIFSF